MVPSSPEHALGVSSSDSSTSQLVSEPSGVGLTEINLPVSHKAISGESSVTAVFQRKLQACCWPPGGPSQANWAGWCAERGSNPISGWCAERGSNPISGWCAERGSDPISGPVADVANFLAYLF